MRAVPLLSLVVCAAVLRAAAPSSQPADVGALIADIGSRVAAYYERARGVICVNESTMQPIDRDWSVTGFARTVESELRIEADAEGPSTGAKVVRTILRVNGRAPQPKDDKARAGCTDPNPLSPEPLSFLLPSRREDFRFTSVRAGREQDHAALIIDFMSVGRRGKLELIADPRGHDDCFDWVGPQATRGRLWVDAGSHDVLRVDRWIEGPTDVSVPQALQRRYNFTPWVVLERDDESLRFTRVRFSDPDEVLLLPSSIDSVTVMRGGLQSMRRSEKFRDYRRFLTASRIRVK